MSYLLTVLWILAVLIWGDWRNWKKYYPTILFVFVIDLIHNLITYSYTLWEYHGTPPLFKTHIITTLRIMFIDYPSTILIYLGHFPRKIIRQVLYVLFWVLIYGVIEFSSKQIGGITYSHGWNFGWSILIDLLMFFIIRLHYTRVFWAWVAALAVFAFTILHFGIPIGDLK